MESFVNALAYETPTPGGGAAAAHCAGCATALILKVVGVWACRETVKGGIDFEGLTKKIEQLTLSLDGLVDGDSQAYLNLSAARKTGDAGRIEQAIAASTDPLLSMMMLVQEAAEILLALGSASPKYLRADLMVSIELLNASMTGAQAIVRANLGLCHDKRFMRDVQKQVEQLVFKVGYLLERAKENISSRTRYVSPR